MTPMSQALDCSRMKKSLRVVASVEGVVCIDDIPVDRDDSRARDQRRGRAVMVGDLVFEVRLERSTVLIRDRGYIEGASSSAAICCSHAMRGHTSARPTVEDSIGRGSKHTNGGGENGEDSCRTHDVLTG